MKAVGCDSGRRLAVRSLASLTLVLTIAPPLALAEPPPAPPIPAPAPEANPPALTTFECRIVAVSDVIVVGTARLVGGVTIKGTTVARVDVEKVLKGTVERSFTLFVGGPRSTDDPRVRSPSTPYVDKTARRAVLFLRTTPNGSGLSLDTLLPIDDFAGQEKLGVLEQELAVFALPDPVERKRSTLALLVTFVAGDRPWTRTHGIREVESLSRRAPDAFDDASLARLDALRRGVADRSERAVLAATLDRLDPDRARRERGTAMPAPTEAVTPTPSTDGPARATETKAYRRAQRRFTTGTDDEARVSALSEMARVAALAAAPDLIEAFREPSGAVRERAAVLLADVGADADWPQLRAAFDTEKATAVREALVRAAGFVGTAADVAWVMRVAVGVELRRARCFALARLRTPEALAALAAEGDAAHSATPPDTAIATLVDYLAGPVFAKSDPALVRRAMAPPAPPLAAPVPPAPGDALPPR